MGEGFIRARDDERDYKRALARFREDASISDRNKELVLRFLRDAALGKTLPGRGRKRIGPSRRQAYLYHLRPLIMLVEKDLDQVSEDDVERFVEALGNNLIRRCSAYRADRPLSDRYKCDIRVTVKKFYKWLWGESQRYPPLVAWIDTFVESAEVTPLTEPDVQRMIDSATCLMQRAIIQVLYDTGVRIGELVNIRLHHVRLHHFDSDSNDGSCFELYVPFSKTQRRPVYTLMPTTTRLVTAWLEKHPARPTIAAGGSIHAPDLDAQLFPKTANAIRLFLRRIGARTLGRRVYPHLLRHTSATWCGNMDMPYFKLCRRFGWSLSSRQAQRYVHRAGLDQLRTAEQFHRQRRHPEAMESRMKEQSA